MTMSLLFASKPQLLFTRKHHHRSIKRRRLKRRALTLHNNLIDPLQNDNVLSTSTSTSNNILLAPLLALASGLSLYLTKTLKTRSDPCPGSTDWVLFTSPTPFNRFVLLRCPSIAFEDGEAELSGKLVEEERHFVVVNTGAGREVKDGENGDGGVELEYQRVCIGTEDGGVVSLDWPASLELEEEHGLDTTLLIVPGTTSGSMEEAVRVFVKDALRRGFFPVVMNPRGCAGSPLTTPRLFTAADSDDICTAVEFINKARPWTTLMGVGWGYGANMLTKYLVEVGERTPLTAATCVNNPFDLDEATRSSPYDNSLDTKLTRGLRDILKSNKALFQGRAKGFNVEKALSAVSVRDFERAISMVSFGYDEIEDFYSKSSTRNLIGNIKVPVLFIQNDNGSVPLFSIPRSSIAENPFTSLLLCSSIPSSSTASGRAAASWCQNLTIEWLTAVELGLLKGRHPLLKDVDVNVNPSNGLALAEGRASNRGHAIGNLLDLSLTDANRYSIDAATEVFEDEDGNTDFRPYIRTIKDLGDGMPGADNGVLTGSVDEECEASEEPINHERGEMLQTALVIMNILDVTMSGVLQEDEKEKVLAAVGQGETVMKALHDAVPEDVREKLTAALSGILSAQRTNLKVDGLLAIDKISSVSSGLKSNIQEMVQVSSTDSAPKEVNSSDNNLKRCEDSAEGGAEAEFRPSDNAQKVTTTDQALGHLQSDNPDLISKEMEEVSISSENDLYNKDKVVPSTDCSERAVEASVTRKVTSHSEKGASTEEVSLDVGKVEDESGFPQRETKRESQKSEEEASDPLADQNKKALAEEVQSPMGPPSDSQQTEKEGGDNQKSESKIIEPLPDQNKPPAPDPKPPTFNVVQALDALTGVDDSTQVAVNSVFEVIESMIDQLEEGKGNGMKTVDSINGVNGDANDSGTKEKHSSAGKSPPLNGAYKTDSVHNSAITGFMEQETVEDPVFFRENRFGESISKFGDYKNIEIEKNDQLVGGKPFTRYTHKNMNKIPLQVDPHHYWDYYRRNKYLGRYLLSKIPKENQLDLDSTTALLLDYYPEEGQWKLLEQPPKNAVPMGDFPSRTVADNYIEPTYIVCDQEKQQLPVAEHSTREGYEENTKNHEPELEDLMKFVKKVIKDALKVEVSRKLSSTDLKRMKATLNRDLEAVADAVSLVISHDKDQNWCLQGEKFKTKQTYEKVGAVQGEHIIKAISSAVLSTNYLRKVLPVGVIIGSSLAALRNHFNVCTHDNGLAPVNQAKRSLRTNHYRKDIGENPHRQTISSSNTGSKGEVKLNDQNNNGIMVGAVTAALGASALLVQQQNSIQKKETVENSSMLIQEKGIHHKAAQKIDEAASDKNHNNIVTSLAEKAMTVAGPVVPTKEDGEVDQDRLLAMLAEVGQRGGMLRLVGKIALLWGGIRGAMSLTDRLISFLHIAERPWYQRILGFVAMVVVLWSPVIIPLLPTLVQSWTAGNPSRFAELVCIVGLYAAVMILVMLWGRRIRGYQNPIEQYGLDLLSSNKMQNFLKGLTGGVVLVLSIQSVKTLLGCASFSWPANIPSTSLGAFEFLKMYGKLIILVSRGIVTAAGVVLVEELLFRSLLPEEIAADLGYHQGIIIAGLAFSLFQRSFWAVPGLWLLSLSLAGLRQRDKGSLAVPIGLRVGMMASSFVLQTGGLIKYNSLSPIWLTGTHPLQPLSGVVGLGFCIILAFIQYPKAAFTESK